MGNYSNFSQHCSGSQTVLHEGFPRDERKHSLMNFNFAEFFVINIMLLKEIGRYEIGITSSKLYLRKSCYRTGWRSSNGLTVLGGARFEFRPGHRLS
jgi:hypothetical protein